jgi:methyl-accepting chemotaxis protein
MSESGTAEIAGGVERANMLEDKFASMKNASEITAERAEKITAIIKQQTSATEQILMTLKQISAGVENFSQATNKISSASQALKNIAEGLS